MGSEEKVICLWSGTRPQCLCFYPQLEKLLLFAVVDAHPALLDHQGLVDLQEAAGPHEAVHGRPQARPSRSPALASPWRASAGRPPAPPGDWRGGSGERERPGGSP